MYGLWTWRRVQQDMYLIGPKGGGMLHQNVRITARFHTLKIPQNIKNTIVKLILVINLHYTLYQNQNRNDNLAVDYEITQHGQSGNWANSGNTVTSLL